MKGFVDSYKYYRIFFVFYLVMLGYIAVSAIHEFFSPNICTTSLAMDFVLANFCIISINDIAKRYNKNVRKKEPVEEQGILILYLVVAVLIIIVSTLYFGIVLEWFG